MYTVRAYDQHLHLDEDTKENVFFLHIPLTEEGSFIRALVGSKKGEKIEKKIHIPFGTFLVLPSYVYHAGVYGNKGNYRLHIAVRSVYSQWEEDTLESAYGEKKTVNSPINTECNFHSWTTHETTTFTIRYLNMLKRNCGVWFKEAHTSLIPGVSSVV